MGPLAEAELDAERAPRDRDLVAVFGRVEAAGLPAARTDPVDARAVRAELHSAAGGLDRHLDAERSRDVDGKRAALDPDRHRALGRPQGDIDAAGARLAVEGADGGGGEVEVATDGPRVAAHLPRNRVGDPGVDVEAASAREPVGSLADPHRTCRPVELDPGRCPAVLDMHLVQLFALEARRPDVDLRRAHGELELRLRQAFASLRAVDVRIDAAGADAGEEQPYADRDKHQQPD